MCSRFPSRRLTCQPAVTIFLNMSRARRPRTSVINMSGHIQTLSRSLYFVHHQLATPSHRFHLSYQSSHLYLRIALDIRLACVIQQLQCKSDSRANTPPQNATSALVVSMPGTVHSLPHTQQFSIQLQNITYIQHVMCRAQESPPLNSWGSNSFRL
ncbi:hypothetical protein BJ138DRAFT_1158594 [Hygrophoropsis aurantiaca]|uniref:Uncharacterized protein n=1 Tax=Hygrophoropsis aurantiaca TaxID=72124 RepID=A0ACB8A4S8_9AGAM|nr:hypothetical protein BJ138DRAFT_1158594 [Hygrophoropsis aurantiaca]